MLHESAHVCVSTDDGIATVWLAPPHGRIGGGVLRELLIAIERVSQTPGIEILALRAGSPHGFGRGIDWTEASERLPRLGQRVTTALADLPMATLAFLEGQVIGPALELALACDYRLAVAGPDSWVGFGEIAPGWGGRTRLQQLTGRRLTDPVTAREAVALGIFDHASCERRGKIELRTWLDRLQARPHKRLTGWRGGFVNTTRGFAAERFIFRASLTSSPTVPPSDGSPVRPLRSLGLIGIGRDSCRIGAEWAMRGASVVWIDGPNPQAIFAEPLRRGRLTPLEAEHAVGRLCFTHDADAFIDCDWVMLDAPHTDLAGMLERDLLPRTILTIPPEHLDRASLLATRSQRVLGLRLTEPAATIVFTDDTASESAAALAGWLGPVSPVRIVTHRVAEKKAVSLF